MAEKDFTDREMEIMAKAWTCMVDQPKVDYEKLAGATGMSNPRSAANAWANIKKKIMAKGGMNKDKDAEGGTGGEGTPKATPKTTPKSTGKRKKGANANGGTGDDAEAEATPSKKPKTGKGKAKKSEVKVQEETDAEADDDGLPIKAENYDEAE